jgi:2-methylisocitrate lyase-like PEP mutase family enzyme
VGLRCRPRLSGCLPATREDIATIVRGVHGPISVNMGGAFGGKTPSINLADLREMGVGRVSYPVMTLTSAGAAMRRALQTLMTQGDLVSIKHELMSFSEVTAVVGLESERAREQAFAS